MIFIAQLNFSILLPVNKNDLDLFHEQYFHHYPVSNFASIHRYSVVHFASINSYSLVIL